MSYYDYDELEKLMRDLNVKLKVYDSFVSQQQKPPIELIASINSLRSRIDSLNKLINRENKSRSGYGNIVNRFVTPKEMAKIDAQKYGLDDDFVEHLLAQVDDIDFINNGTNHNISDLELLDIDSRENRGKHCVFFSRDNDSSLKLMYIDGVNKRYSIIHVSVVNGDRVEVFISSFENGEVYRFYHIMKSDNRAYNTLCEFYSKDETEKNFHGSSLDIVSLYDFMENGSIERPTELFGFSPPKSIEYDNVLTFVLMLFNNGIGNYVVSKKDASGGTYLDWNDDKINQDLAKMTSHKKQSR